MERYRRWRAGVLVEEIETLHVFEGEQRILIVETVKTPENTEGVVLYRYQYSNHLGSASLEMDGSDTPRIISYEEYHPYGTTAYHAQNADIKAAAKRYRYTGMERDEETGLNYHAARYYAVWLGRWVSCDPIGTEGGMNVYQYSSCNPIRIKDPSGNYGEAGHFYTVYFVSLAAGFDPETAFRNAFFAQMPDEVSQLDAKEVEGNALLPSITVMGYGIEAYRDLIQRGLHSLTGDSSQWERETTGQAIRSQSPGTVEMGLLLHRFGDTYAHSVIGDERRMYGTGLGHLRDWHSPDQIHMRPELYADYVRNLFYNLADVATRQGLTPRLSVEQIDRFSREIGSIREYRTVSMHRGFYEVLDVEATEARQIERIRELSEEYMARTPYQESNFAGPPTPGQPPVGRMRQYAPEIPGAGDTKDWAEFQRSNPGPTQGMSLGSVLQSVHRAAALVGEDR